MSSLELFLDAGFTRVIEEAKKEFSRDADELLAGEVAGFMLATAIEMARRAGCPRKALEDGLLERIAKAYGS